MKEAVQSSQSPGYLGLDIGGTKTAVILADRQAHIHRRVEFPTRAERGFDTVYQDILINLQAFLKNCPPPVALGVSIGGPLDSRAGVILSPPNLPGWDRIPLKDLLGKDTQLPVKVMHDAKTGALAEWWFGAGQGCSDMIFLTFGTGLGCGVITAGRLLETIPGEVGHWGIGPENGPWIYGRTNAWEGVSSGAGIAALAAQRYPKLFGTRPTARQVIESAREGSVEAGEILAVVSEYLGKGIALLVDLFGTQKVVLGSLAIRAGDIILPRCREVFRQEAHPALQDSVEICAGKLADQIGDYGALCAALYGTSEENHQETEN